MNSSAQMIFDMSDVESKENIPQKKLISKYDFSQVFEGQINNEYHNNNSMVILGDSLDVLKKMKSKTVQLIFADAPYNIGKNFGNNLDKWKNVNDYVEWCKRWLDECFRILSDDGTIYFMTATQHMPFLDVYISEKYNVLCRIVWAYDSSGMQSKKIFGSLYEPILMANKSKKSKYTFNQNDILVEAKTGAKRKLIDYRKDPPQLYNSEKVPGNVWDFSRVRFRMQEYENHPTQKPEALLERIIKASSNVGDLILDPFSGSFTTSAVAVRLGRGAIGIDINEEYCKIGIRRTGISSFYHGEELVKQKEKRHLQDLNIKGDTMKIIEEFVESILREAYPLTYQFIYDQSTLLQYLDGKMKAVHGDSKITKKFGEYYAVYSILFFIKKILQCSR